MRKRATRILALMLCPALCFAQTAKVGPQTTVGPATIPLASTVVPPSLVTGQVCQGFTTTAQPSINCVFPNPIGAGHQAFFCIDSISSIGTVTWTGDTGTFTRDLNNLSWDGGAVLISCFHLLSAAGGGSATINAASSGQQSTQIVGAEFQGATGGLDQSDAGATGTSTAISSGSVTTTANGELILGLVASVATPGPSVGSGYTLAVQSTSNFYVLEFQVQSTAGVIAATATTASANWVAHVVTIK